MKKLCIAVLALMLVAVFMGCPSKPAKHSDPDKAKANAERGMGELDREMDKRQ